MSWDPHTYPDTLPPSEHTDTPGHNGQEKSSLSFGVHCCARPFSQSQNASFRLLDTSANARSAAPAPLRRACPARPADCAASRHAGHASSVTHCISVAHGSRLVCVRVARRLYDDSIVEHLKEWLRAELQERHQPHYHRALHLPLQVQGAPLALSRGAGCASSMRLHIAYLCASSFFGAACASLADGGAPSCTRAPAGSRLRGWRARGPPLSMPPSHVSACVVWCGACRRAGARRGRA